MVDETKYLFLDEVAQLKAQVERLRVFVLEVRDEFPCDYDTVNELLKETSAQSLLFHDAEVLEKFMVKHGLMKPENWSEHIVKECAKLRQQALEETYE